MANKKPSASHKTKAKNPVSPKSDRLQKDSLSKPLLILFAVVFAGIGTYALLKSFAAPATPSLYLTPASSSFNIGDTVSLNIYEDSGTDTVNGVQANLTYPNALLSFAGVNNSAAFSLAAQTSGGNGSVQIARATCAGCPPVTGMQLVATVNFTALAGGTANVDFANSSAVVRSTDNLSENLNMAGGSYTIDPGQTTPPPPPPATPPPASPPPAAPPPSSSGGSTGSSGSSSSHTSPGGSGISSPVSSSGGSTAPTPPAPDTGSAVNQTPTLDNGSITPVATKKASFKLSRTGWLSIAAGALFVMIVLTWLSIRGDRMVGAPGLGTYDYNSHPRNPASDKNLIKPSLSASGPEAAAVATFLQAKPEPPVKSVAKPATPTPAPVAKTIAKTPPAPTPAAKPAAPAAKAPAAPAPKTGARPAPAPVVKSVSAPLKTAADIPSFSKPGAVVKPANPRNIKPYIKP